MFKKFNKGYNVVDYKEKIKYGDILYCKIYDYEKCELYCEQCEILVCLKCFFGKFYKGYDYIEILVLFDFKRICVIKERDSIKNYIQLLKE